MDLTTFKLDIDELLEDFTMGNSTTWASMKRVWLAKKFSYIYEASPSSNSAFFMQALFSHSIGHLSSSTSLSRRIGGLYCLYCLYETQPYKPRVKIYLCLGDLKRLKMLAIDAKLGGVRAVHFILKRMLTENMFLFGSSDTRGSHNQRIEAATKLQDKTIQIAYEKLLAYTEIEDYVHMNLSMELGLESFKKMSIDYAKAKEKAFKEASETESTGNSNSTTENTSLASDAVEKLAKEWDSQKESFYKQIGFDNCREIVPLDTDGFSEVERLLEE